MGLILGKMSDSIGRKIIQDRDSLGAVGGDLTAAVVQFQVLLKLEVFLFNEKEGF